MSHESKITVTIDAPEGLPPIKALLTCEPKTLVEFDAVVEAVGGPCAFDYHRPDRAHARLADGTTLILEAPDKRSFRTPPLAPSIHALKAACDRD